MPEGRTTSSSPLFQGRVLPQSTSAEEGTAARLGDSTIAAASGSIERASSDDSAIPTSASSTSEALRLAQAELTRLRRLVEERRARDS